MPGSRSMPAAAAPAGVAAEPVPTALLLAAPTLLLALCALPFRYDVTLSEPDLVRMMAALVYGQATGLQESAGQHYGLSFSFGYYKLLYALAPDAWLRDPDLAARLVSGVGVASGLACALACTIYLSRLFGSVAGTCAAALFLLSPMMLPVALSGHPVVPAAACAFGGGWLLLAAEDRTVKPRGACLAAAFVVLLAGLTLRAEIALVFPFLWLAGSRPLSAQAWASYAWRALVLGAAFAAFLFLQQGYVESAGGASGRLGRFLASFMSPGLIGRGLAVFTLAAGMATLFALVLAVRSRLLEWRHALLAVFLAGPGLALWLPNPQPARHFFFPALAACVLVGLWLARRSKSAPVALGLAVALALANQLAGEALRPAIVAHYSWSYPSVAPRRATQQAPLGFFPLDQRANQAQVDAERVEAIAVAARAPARLVILADFQHYLIAHLVAAHPALRWTETTRDGRVINELRGPGRHIVLVEKSKGWPRDATAEILASTDWADWPIYVQPSTLSRYDKTEIPPQQRFRP